VPVRIRQALNVESGLNDGLALPALLFAVSLATMAGHATDGAHWLRFVALQLGLGPLVGAAVGYFGGRGVSWARRRGWMSDSFERLAALGLALLAWAGADLAGGNGFIAAFAAGLILGNTARAVCSCLYGLLILENAVLEHQSVVFAVTVLTVLLSVFLHGATAWPGVRWYGAWAEGMRDQPAMPEMKTVSEMPVRLRHEGVRSARNGQTASG
jgi:NhaP-type Na+/H+ or K+/H+ antiporter